MRKLPKLPPFMLVPRVLSCGVLLLVWSLSSIAADRQAGPCNRRSPFVISEIMYHPPAPHQDTLEFVEIHNSEPIPHDISGYRLSGEIGYTFPTGTVIGAQSLLVVALDPASIENHYGITNVLGPFEDRLPNGGGTVRLRNRRDSVLVDVESSDDSPWPIAADGAGHSLVMTKPDYGPSSCKAWSASANAFGSPGSLDPAAPTNGVIISEFLAHTDLPDVDFVEFFNPGRSQVDLSGYRVTDQSLTNGITLPPGTTVDALDYMHVYLPTTGVMSLNASGDDIYLFEPSGSNVIDCVRFDAQARGISCGRNVGEHGLHALETPTPGNANADLKTHDIVISEIMYNPISGDEDDCYIELYNRGAQPWDLAHWRFIDGISFTFPSNSIVPADGYLVIARDALRLISRYDGTLNTTNCIGDFSGTLANRGERIALAKPDDLELPNQDFVVIDEVTYGDGHRWGKWTDGDGSSLELVDMDSDNRRAMNWAGSDESHKTSNMWTRVEFTGVQDNGRNGGSEPQVGDELQVLLFDSGECLVDNVEVLEEGDPANRISNGTFDSNIDGWIKQGTHIDTSWESSEGLGGGGAMHLKSSGAGDNSVNRIEQDLSPVLGTNTVATIRADVRWLAGHRNILLRFHGNWLEAVGHLSVPTALGTPGQPNSRQTDDTGPAIWDVAHAPVCPAANESVVVRARAHDPDGVAQMYVRYRNDPDSAELSQLMYDDGSDGDLVPGDGQYAATIPGRGANQTLAFYVDATDAGGGSLSSSFPETAPDTECVVMFGQAETGSYGSYRFWMTEATRSFWNNRQKMSDDLNPGTFIYGNWRAVYEAGGRFRGSPFIRRKGNPETLDTSFVIHMPKDDRFLDTVGLNLDRLERDNSKLRERVSYWIAGRLDVPTSYQRYVHLYINEIHKGSVYGDIQQPNADYLKCHYSGDSDGEMIKIDDWFEFNDNNDISKQFNVDGALYLYTTTGGAKKTARYRWSWMLEPDNTAPENYTNFFALVDTMNLGYTTPQYGPQVSTLVDVEEWMRAFAARHIVSDYDGYGYNRGKNSSLYKAEGGQWQMLLWDLDMGLGANASWGPNRDLFVINDGVLKNHFFEYPSFRRAYWRALRESCYDALLPALSDPIIDDLASAHADNGVTASLEATIKTWISDRRTYILGQLAPLEVPFQITNNGGARFSTDEHILDLTGIAPVEATRFEINGQQQSFAFESVTNWTAEVGLAEGDNQLEALAYDRWGSCIATSAVTVTLTAAAPDPSSQLVINEIMYNPAPGGTDFVEIFNRSQNYSFDVSGYRLNGVDYVFPAGSVIAPQGFLVLTEDGAAFQAQYGSAAKGEYSGSLDNGGERLRLERPVASNVWEAVDIVRYDDALPWPPGADGTGPSLQLIDPDNDNGMPGNWSADPTGLYTPGETNSIAAALGIVPQLLITEIQPNNVSSIADGKGDYDPWVELLNVGEPNVLAVELHQATPAGGDAWMSLTLSSPLTSAVEEVTLIPRGATWSYLDDGSNQGTAWRMPGFDDSGWSNGLASLGHNNNPVTLLQDTDPNFATYYFRHTFTVSNHTTMTQLDVSAQRDDGIVVYINGTEVWRDNMPSGFITYETWASAAATGGNETFWFSPASPLSASVVSNGTNVIAVELHQISETSSDVSFDLGLVATHEYDHQSEMHLASNAVWRYLDTGVPPGDAWTDPSFDDDAWPSGNGPFGYGTGNEGTLLASNPVTHYFRHELVVPTNLPVDTTMNVACDDGMVVYLNGEELVRTNLPQGTLTNTTRAVSSVDVPGYEHVSSHIFSVNGLRRDGDLTTMTNVYLTVDTNTPAGWQFPAGISMDAGERRIVWADAEPGETAGDELHADFTLSPTGGYVAVVWVDGGREVVLDYLHYGTIGPNQAYGRSLDYDRDADYRILSYPTPGASNDTNIVQYDIVINEWMALNTNTTMDGAGDYDDWIELYNSGSNTVDLTGFTLTDTSDEPSKWTFPAGTQIAAGGFLLVWADDEAVEGNLHASFGLKQSGEEVLLFDSNSTLYDWVTFDQQAADISEGRYRDGGAAIHTMNIPTPGESNVLFDVMDVHHVDHQFIDISFHAREGAGYQLYQADGLIQPMTWALLGAGFSATDRVHTVRVPITWTNTFKAFQVREQ